jgi:FixJ family two-component response regulator
VLEAANGAEAMRILLNPGSKPVHLLMTDLVMPLMGGKELAQRALELFPDMRVIYISGYPVPANADLLPGAQLLQKPFSPKTLADAVQEALENKAV